MKKPSFTLEQLRSFLAVAETEHISRAAASLFLTQGAVTQQLRHLEQGLRACRPLLAELDQAALDL